MKKQIALALALPLITSLACSVLSKTSRLTGTPVIGLSATEASPEPCVEGWVIKPTAVYQYPIGNSTNLVIVDLGLKNGSKYWGKISTYDAQVVLTSEDGSTFKPLAYNPEGVLYHLPSTPDSIYASHAYGENDSTFGTNWIAPGFVNNGLIVPRWANSEPYHFHFAFRVPNTQKHYHISFSNVEVDCAGFPWLGNDGKIYTDVGGSDRLPPMSFDLDRDAGPVRESTGSWSRLGGKVHLSGGQELSFESVQREKDTVKAELTVTNNTSNIAYVVLTPYVIGEDGLQRFVDCNTIEECRGLNIYFDGNWNRLEINLDPGKTVKQEIYFTVPAELKRISFVLTTGGDSAFPGEPQVFSLNP